MNFVCRLLKLRMTNDRLDGEFGRWSCYLSGPALVAVVCWHLFRNRHFFRSTEQMAIVLSLGLMTCAIMILLGTLTARIHLLEKQKKIPHRSRLLEYAGYTGGVILLTAGMWYLTTLSTETPEMMMGILIVLSACLGLICLGMASTLCLTFRPRVKFSERET